jgi:hypothetical protein
VSHALPCLRTHHSFTQVAKAMSAKVDGIFRSRAMALIDLARISFQIAAKILLEYVPTMHTISSLRDSGPVDQASYARPSPVCATNHAKDCPKRGDVR